MLHSMTIKTHTCWSAWDPQPMLWGQMLIWGHLGSRSRWGSCRSNDAMALVSSSICQHVNISETLCPIMLILGHNNKSANAHFWHDQFGVKGHVGVTGIKKFIFTKKFCFSFRLNGMAMGLMRIHQLDTLYISYGSRNSAGVIWGHKVQKVIFTKNAISPSYYMVWSCDSCLLISKIPSTKVMGLEIHPGSFRIRGVKSSFSLKICYNSYTHVHKLETLYLFCGVTGQSGVILGRGGSNHYFDTTFIAH